MRICGDIMTANPICCLPTDTVIHVAQLMKIGDVGSIPVVEGENSQKLVGIITDRDLALRVVRENMDANSTIVKQVMTRNPVACYAHEDLDKAMKIMKDHQVRRIPIINKNNEVLGMISQADIAIRVDQPQKTADVVEEISKPTIKENETSHVKNWAP
jgi:CBS domain-containing protein